MRWESARSSSFFCSNSSASKNSFHWVFKLSSRCCSRRLTVSFISRILRSTSSPFFFLAFDSGKEGSPTVLEAVVASVVVATVGLLRGIVIGGGIEVDGFVPAAVVPWVVLGSLVVWDRNDGIGLLLWGACWRRVVLCFFGAGCGFSYVRTCFGNGGRSTGCSTV